MRSLLNLLALAVLTTAQAEPTPLQWPEPTTFHRPGAYWWWMGSAVDEENITGNLETMREAGMGGGTIVAIYGVKGREDQYVAHLSPRWIDLMSHAVKEAERLGMWIDMTPGTGWPYGGPMITDDDCDATVTFRDGKLGQKFSGRMVKRAAPGGVGKAINPYSPQAMRDYLKHFDRAFAREGVALPRAMYHDSFEFRGNWDRRLPDEFLKRHGYALTGHLPALFGQGDPDTVARIKADYRETLSDLHLDYIKVLADWADGHGRTVRNQAHGAPANLLDLYGAVGIPETETFGASPFRIPGIRREAENVRSDRPQPLINRMASSAAHVMGRQLVASESCTWVRNHFRASLAQVKPEIDQLFLNGINHVFFHGTCYSPQDAPWPGWLFYASLQYNPRNAIWRDAKYLNAYITRCQSILQSGAPDNDIALYWPVHDIWHSPKGMQQQLTVHHAEWLTEAPAGQTAARLDKLGYTYDFISDRQLLADRAAPYKAIVVPETKHMPLATLRKLLALAERGQTLVFLDKLPADIPGFHRFQQRRADLKNLLQGRDYLVTSTDELPVRLAKALVPRETMVDSGLSFTRRRHAHGHHYFVANMGKDPVDRWIKLGRSFKGAVIMDPHSARTGVAHTHNNEVYLQLRPGETRIIRTLDHPIDGPRWPTLHETNPVTIEGTWQVTFIDGGPKLPTPFQTDTLKSWTERGDAEAQRFAGTARYAIEFTLPATKADEWIIDLGEVRESARVIINGQKAAVLYSHPFRASVGRFLKPGRNRIEIEVTNLSANRIRDLDRRKVDWKRFHDANIVTHQYKKFDASQWPLTPSGLLGPVTFIPAHVGTPIPDGDIDSERMLPPLPSP